jgi:hypothetical protein
VHPISLELHAFAHVARTLLYARGISDRSVVDFELWSATDFCNSRTGVMKSIHKYLPLVVGILGFGIAQLATAAACNLDTFLGAQNLGNSGAGTELAAMEVEAGGIQLAFDNKFDSGGTGFNIQACSNDPNRFYIDVAPDTPGYFLLKFGIGGTSATDDTFFFQNIAELSELVFTSAEVECLIGGPGCPHNTNTGRLSHYTLYNGSSNRVPEPGTLALLGIGALGFAYVRRRKR